MKRRKPYQQRYGFYGEQWGDLAGMLFAAVAIAAIPLAIAIKLFG